MIFEGSSFEEQINQLWNQSIVSVDTMIRSWISDASIIDIQFEEKGKSIQLYRDNARHFLNELQSLIEKNNFEDKNYLKRYTTKAKLELAHDMRFYINKVNNIKDKNSQSISGGYNPSAFYNSFFNSRSIREETIKQIRFDQTDTYIPY